MRNRRLHSLKAANLTALAAGGAILAALAAGGAEAITSIRVPYERLEKNGRALSLNASFASRAGNGPGFTAGGAFLSALSDQENRHVFYLRAGGDYGEFEDTITASSSLAHARHQYRLRRWLSTDLFVQAQQDRFQRLRSRRLAGGGPAFYRRAGRVSLRAGAGVMHEAEHYRTADNSAEPDRADTLRATSYLMADAALGNGAELTLVAYFQPRLTAIDDVRILSDTSLSLSLGGNMRAGLSLVVRHDSRPPASVKRTDVDFRQTLGLTL